MTILSTPTTVHKTGSIDFITNTREDTDNMDPTLVQFRKDQPEPPLSRNFHVQDDPLHADTLSKKIPIFWHSPLRVTHETTKDLEQRVAICSLVQSSIAEGYWYYRVSNF